MERFCEDDCGGWRGKSPGLNAPQVILCETGERPLHHHIAESEEILGNVRGKIPDGLAQPLGLEPHRGRIVLAGLPGERHHVRQGDIECGLSILAVKIVGNGGLGIVVAHGDHLSHQSPKNVDERSRTVIRNQGEGNAASPRQATFRQVP